MNPRTRCAVVLAAALMASTACGRGGPAAQHGPVGESPAEPREALGFVLHRDAVDFPGVGDWVPYGTGLRDLVPLGDCVFGSGVYSNGHRNVGATWLGDPDCTRLRLDPAPDDGQGGERAQGWSGAPFGGVTSIVDLGDGTMVALSADTVLRRDADGGVEQLADFDLPRSAPAGEGGDRAGVCGLAVTVDGMVVSGYINDDRLLWIVAGDGSVSGPEPLPASGATAAGGFCHMAAAGDAVAAIGHAGSGPRAAWFSADGGRTWEHSSIDGLSGRGAVLDLRPHDDGWRALATAGPDSGPLDLVWLDSADGLHWTVTGRESLGEGEAVDVAYGADGAPIVIGDVSTAVEGREQRAACNFVLVAADTWPELTWERGDLGCADDPLRAVAVLDDGRVLIASNRHLWIRSP